MMVSEFMDRLVWREIVPFLKLTASLHLKLDGWMVENHHSYTPKNLAANKPWKTPLSFLGQFRPIFQGANCLLVLWEGFLHFLPSHLGFGLGSLGTLGTAPSTLGTAGTAPSPVQDGSPGVDVGRNYLVCKNLTFAQGISGNSVVYI